MLYLQSWQAAFVVIITIASVSFFTYVGSGGAEASLDWTLVSFVVLLPQVLLLVLVSQFSLTLIPLNHAQPCLTTKSEAHPTPGVGRKS